MTLFLPDITLASLKAQDEREIRLATAAKLGIADSDILALRIKKKSLDARKKPNLVYHFQIEVDTRDDLGIQAKNPETCTLLEQAVDPDPLAGLRDLRDRFHLPPVIIGSGPAGQSAAYIFAEAGIPCIVIERGQAVEQRIRDVNTLRSKGVLDPESNYCYGEGGAGTFSDGKLTCGRRHPLIRHLFQMWVRFGAPEEILYEAHPHIGTDYLIKMTMNLRKYLATRGCDFLFGKRLIGLTRGEGARVKIELSGGESIETDHLVLAIGHSARETYEMLHTEGLAMQPKPFAMGVRVEHPQDEIDAIQFGTCHKDLGVPAAEYKLAAHEGDRGIWTFCMCPGGHLLPTSAQEGHLAINGMSYHARNSGFANAALVVNILREDFYRSHVLDGMRFQADLERKAFAMGGGNYVSPAQRLGDFLKGKASQGEMKSTYRPSISSGRLDRLLPPFVVKSLQAALHDYNKRMRGFISDQALVVGLESKTSSPIVMTRGADFQSVSHAGVFPCGEGAGFAGGIVSAALDGLRVAQGVLQGELSQHPVHVTEKV